jgi:hypothetical protein
VGHVASAADVSALVAMGAATHDLWSPHQSDIASKTRQRKIVVWRSTL